jgi:hypothetical protein
VTALDDLPHLHGWYGYLLWTSISLVDHWTVRASLLLVIVLVPTARRVYRKATRGSGDLRVS